MCLDPGFRCDNRVGRGYKVFSTKAHGHYDDQKYVNGCFFGGKTDVWLRDNPEKGESDCPRLSIEGDSHPRGFHIFKTLKGAKRWAGSRDVIYPVEYRHVLARGTQDGEPAVVALEVKINTEYGWEVQKDYDIGGALHKASLKKFTG